MERSRGLDGSVESGGKQRTGGSRQVIGVPQRNKLGGFKQVGEGGSSISWWKPDVL